MPGRYVLPLVGVLVLASCDDDKQVTDDTGVTPDVHIAGDVGDGAVPDAPAGEGLLPDLGPDFGSRNEWLTVQDPAPEVADHTVTLLKNGDVLIAGGTHSDGSNDNYQDKAYRFVPGTEMFEAAGTMTVERGEHVAALLDDGRVLVAGGKNDQDYLKSAEIFDPSKPAAQAWSAVPDMFKHRWGHTATTLNNGEVLIAGGFYSNDSSDTIVLFDPVNNNWKQPSAIFNEARRGHTATLLANGKVLFAGGIQGSGSLWTTTYLDSIEIFDPTSGKMTLSKAVMSKQRTGHSATLLPSGKVLIVGGVCLNNCKATAKQVDDIYDPATDTISPLAHAGDLPSTHVAVLLKDGRVLVAGDVDETTYNMVLAYDPKGGGFWSTLPSLAIGRWSAGGTILNDGTVLVVGGVTSANPTYTHANRAERYYP